MTRDQLYSSSVAKKRAKKSRAVSMVKKRAEERARREAELALERQREETTEESESESEDDGDDEDSDVQEHQRHRQPHQHVPPQRGLDRAPLLQLLNNVNNVEPDQVDPDSDSDSDSDSDMDIMDMPAEDDENVENVDMPSQPSSSSSSSEDDPDNEAHANEPSIAGSEGDEAQSDTDDDEDDIEEEFLRGDIPPQVLELCMAIASVKTSSRISDTAIEKLMKIFFDRADTIKEMKDNGQFGTYRRFVKPRVMRQLPKITFAALIKDTSTDPPTLTYHDNLKAIPEEFIRYREEDKKVMLRQDAKTTISEVKKFHEKRMRARGETVEKFQTHCKEMDLSIDGVDEAQHSTRTFVVASARFGMDIYALHVYNPIKGEPDAKPSPNHILRPLVNEINNDDDIALRFLVADTLERHYLKCMSAHGGRYSCEICLAIAETKPSTHWPFRSTFNKRYRTLEQWRRVANDVENLTPLQAHGVKGRSPLLDIPEPFSIIWSIPLDSFHLCQEGLTKLMVKRLFEKSDTVESRAIMELWNSLFTRCAVFTETSRRTRKITTGSFKGSEFSVLQFTGFPALINLLSDRAGDHWQHAQICIAVYSFLIRAYNVNNEQYRLIKQNLRGRRLTFKELHKMFYKEFELGFCNREKFRPVGNVHAFSHLQATRDRTGVPLWQTSSEPFEGSYSVLRRLHQVGTRNVPRQIMENMYLRIMHTTFTRPERKLQIQTSTNSCRVRDSFIMCNGEVLEVYGEDVQPRFAYKVKTTPFRPNIRRSLPWDLVGIFMFAGYDYTTTRRVRDEDISAKLMRIGDILVTWELPWLMSKYDD